MSANRDLLTSIYAAWEKGDFTSAEWADPEIEFVIVGGPAPGRTKGLGETAKLWASMLEAWDSLRSIADEFRELDDERVLVLMRNEGRGKRSGIDVHEIAAKSANLFTIRNGKVAKLVIYWDRDRALADLGLAPETDSADT